MNVYRDRLWNRIHTLARIGANEDGSITRWPYTDVDNQAKEWIKHEMCNAGLSVSEDYVGNLIGVYNPMGSSLPPVICGSHYDTVLHGGKFDGTLGVLGGLECAQVMIENKVSIKRPLMIIGYKDEEGNRFARGMIGSLSVSGKATEADLDTKDNQGISIREAMIPYGYQPDKLKDCVIKPIHAHVELHIEQGKILEEHDCSVGIVEGIPSLRYYTVTFKGESGHAGATPMNRRKDPVVAFSQWLLELTCITKKYPPSVATVGKIETYPGATNIIADHITFTLDIRSPKQKTIDLIFDELRPLQQQLIREGIQIDYHLDHQLDGMQCDDKLKDRLEQIIQQRGYKYQRLMSGAGHDSQNFKDVCPCVMIFARSEHGYSHRKEEYTTKNDCYEATAVLYDMLIDLCNQ